MKPTWLQTIDTFTAGKALGVGVLLSGVNPKNLALTLAAATAIAQTEIPGASRPSHSPCSFWSAHWPSSHLSRSTSP